MSQNLHGMDPKLLSDLRSQTETLWTNPLEASGNISGDSIQEIIEAEQRLARFAPYIKKVFPEVVNGIIESPIKLLKNMQTAIQDNVQSTIQGQLFLKCDNDLPIAGSIKARGGIYEVLKIAETVAMEQNWIQETDDYSVMATSRFKNLFSRYSIAVGSTGNLGLSIGIMGAALGFKVTVHMSRDAKRWKKELLREKGVKVVEHVQDFSHAVAEGRKQCELDPDCFFIDDENSKDLFMGYAVAALRLRGQFEEEGIIVDQDHPLIVYLPCGVGGGPGGVTYGLKHVFGEHVHCYFAEPVNSPCMLLGLASGRHEEISVQDIGLSNRTEADGLAVGRPSALAGRMINELVNGVYTVSDKNLFKLLALLHHSESIFLEPSAVAGMIGPFLPDLEEHLSSIEVDLSHATHVVWATGGKLVPEAIMEEYVKKGEGYLVE
ncbi:D-serine ammonia-lyase [Rossellomorea sp. LjRoot5]|uniref:D-serine ammonia-lyase n=1 Tax=Rossellomorea sp. LjRoot5 TaxID=3342331 RepID=UPI003ECF69A6